MWGKNILVNAVGAITGVAVFKALEKLEVSEPQQIIGTAVASGVTMTATEILMGSIESKRGAAENLKGIAESEPDEDAEDEDTEEVLTGNQEDNVAISGDTDIPEPESEPENGDSEDSTEYSDEDTESDENDEDEVDEDEEEFSDNFINAAENGSTKSIEEIMAQIPILANRQGTTADRDSSHETDSEVSGYDFTQTQSKGGSRNRRRKDDQNRMTRNDYRYQ